MIRLAIDESLQHEIFPSFIFELYNALHFPFPKIKDILFELSTDAKHFAEMNETIEYLTNKKHKLFFSEAFTENLESKSCHETKILQENETLSEYLAYAQNHRDLMYKGFTHSEYYEMDWYNFEIDRLNIEINAIEVRAIIDRKPPSSLLKQLIKKRDILSLELEFLQLNAGKEYIRMLIKKNDRNFMQDTRISTEEFTDEFLRLEKQEKLLLEKERTLQQRKLQMEQEQAIFVEIERIKQILGKKDEDIRINLSDIKPLLLFRKLSYSNTIKKPKGKDPIMSELWAYL